MVNPPFCPNPGCHHHSDPPAQRWWVGAGFHSTLCSGKVRRFRCLSCGRSFSERTFSIDYYAKKTVDYRKLEGLAGASMCVRALGRAMGLSCDSVQNRFDRLSRQSLACHTRLRSKAGNYDSVSIDGFVSFDRSQYFPNEVTIALTSRARYVLSFTHASLKRSGMMRVSQKQRRDTLYSGLSFERGAIERSFSELLNGLARDRAPSRFRPLVVITDEKPDYARALSRHALFLCQDEDHRVAHLTVNSRLPRTTKNPLFPSNYLDREIRKDQAAHRRETTCFARNASNSMARLVCYLGWHNYAKRFLVGAPRRETSTHGEMAGIDPAAIDRERAAMFHDRAFLSLEKLDAIERRIWTKAIPTPGQVKERVLPGYAYA